MIDHLSLLKLGLNQHNVDYVKSYELYDPTTLNNIIVLYLKKEENLRCIYCNSVFVNVKGTRVNKIKYSTAQINNIIVELHKRVYICTECNHSFTQRNPVVTEGRNISIQKDIKILNALKDITRTYTSIAEAFYVSTTYVINLFDKKVDIKRQSFPEVLCIDEVYTKKLTKTKYTLILYSPQRKKVIDILDSRHKTKLVDYFATVPLHEKSKVKFVSIDMWETYRIIVKKCFPNAILCVDSFHVIKHLNEAFDKIRIKIMNKYAHLKHEGSNYYWLFKKYNPFLKKNYSKITNGKIRVTKSGMYLYKDQIIEYMLSLSPELKLAYELKEEYINFNSSANIDNAEDWLNGLIISFQNSRIPEYVEFWKMLLNWHDEIVNSFNRINGFRISNGPIERVNRDVKTLVNISYGSTNYKRIRNRIMYCINEDASILGIRKSSTNKIDRKPRGYYKKRNKNID